MEDSSCETSLPLMKTLKYYPKRGALAPGVTPLPTPLSSLRSDQPMIEARVYGHARMRNSYVKMLKRVTSQLLLPLLLVVEVQCQTAPYVSFMDQTLADHSYVNISQVGNDFSGSNTVKCHTDLNTCCSNPQGPYRGDWYFPDGDRLPVPDGSGIVESRQAQRVELRRTNPTVMEPTGIYRCDIETVAVHDNGMRETVYVGLYTSDGGKIHCSL